MCFMLHYLSGMNKMHSTGCLNRAILWFFKVYVLDSKVDAQYSSLVALMFFYSFVNFIVGIVDFVRNARKYVVGN